MGSRRSVAVGALVAALCAILAIALLGSGHGAGAHAGGAPAGETTAAVTRRTLSESSTVDGTLGYGATLELYDRLSGTFTWLPSVGATIARGGTLFRVNDLPVVLMYGTVPAYRTLEEGVSDGPDVAELNRNLIDLGYDPYHGIDDSSHFGDATAAAVRRWQNAEGLSDSGEVELGRVIFAPSARRVTSVHVALGQDPPGGEASSGPASSEAPDSEKHPSQHSPSTPQSAKPGERSHGRPPHGKSAGGHPAKHKPQHSPAAPAQHGPAKEHGEGSPESDKGSPAGEGGGDPSKPEGGSGAGTAVLTTTSTQQLVQLKLKAEQQQLARVGERASVSLPGGEVVEGRIVEVGTVASEGKGGEGKGGEGEKGPGGGNGGSPGGEGSGESATIPVTLVLTHRVSRLDQAPVSVDLVKSVRVDVLAVPATALIATAGGGYAVEVLQGARRVQLSVTPGMFADGYVQVEGSGLYEGQGVVESE